MFLSLFGIVSSIYVQLNADVVENSCSYFDPITVDLLAFLLSIFLIFEGSYRIYEHKNISLKKQLTRSIRISFGFAILTIHIIQVLYKV